MKVFLVLALAVASVSAGILPLDTPMRPRDLEGAPSINGRITNGKNAAENQFPYQVGLESHLVGELVDHGVVSVGDATLNGRNCGPVTRMHVRDLGQEPSGGGGDGQEQDCEDLHADG